MAKAKILVIDDEEIVRLSCTKALQSEGYDVKTAVSGKEGVALIENETFDLVVIDLKMPVMDGLEVIKTIKQRYPGLKVIIISGYNIIEHTVESIACDTNHYLGKPFTPAELVLRVNEVIGKCL
jgi:DNA-binding NtrC family response regulator